MYKIRDMLTKDGATLMRNHNYQALCSSFHSKNPKDNKQFGVLMFHFGQCGAGTVAHEITHAATYWWKSAVKMKWSDIQKTSPADERYAYLIGYMVSQFWKNWYKIKRNK